MREHIYKCLVLLYRNTKSNKILPISGNIKSINNTDHIFEITEGSGVFFIIAVKILPLKLGLGLYIIGRNLFQR